ncbi:MAG: AtpZ/AtpI family protein [Kofleriaceae bacterium]
MAVERAHSGEIPSETEQKARSASAGVTSPGSSTTSTSDRVAARTRETMRSLKLSSVGIELALSVLIGMFAGRWLDGKLGSAPWLMIGCLLVGFAAGLRSLIHTMDRASRSDAPPTEGAS